MAGLSRNNEELFKLKNGTGTISISEISAVDKAFIETSPKSAKKSFEGLID